MAQQLAAGLRGLARLEITSPVESNAVFVRMPADTEKAMHQRGWKFYTGVVTGEESRLMCSWDTTPEDVDQFVADLRELTVK